MYGSMNFYVGVYSCNPHPNPDTDYMFITQQVFSYLLPVNNHLHKGNHYFHIYGHTIVLTLLNFIKMWIYCTNSLGSGLFDLMCLCDFCMLCIAYILIAVQHSWVNIPQSVSCTLDGHLNCIQFGLLWIMHLWTFQYMSFDGRLPLISVIYQREELQGVRTYTCLTLLVYTAKQFLKVVVPMYNPTTIFDAKRGAFRSFLHKGLKIHSLWIKENIS